MGLMKPVPAMAQAVPESFADLPNTLKPGQAVVVTDVGGCKTQGVVLDLNDSFMTLRLGDRWAAGQRVRFDEGRVTTIRRTDSIWNGLLIGLGAGVVASEVWRRSECGPRGYDSECSAIVTAVGWVTMVPAGAVTGALIDKFTGNRLVYRSRGSGMTLRLSPVIGPAQASAAVSVRF
jgi:hypothetical protein